jgi:hypothetical protein
LSKCLKKTPYRMASLGPSFMPPCPSVLPRTTNPGNPVSENSSSRQLVNIGNGVTL